jgi:hypothetical protein
MSKKKKKVRSCSLTADTVTINYLHTRQNEEWGGLVVTTDGQAKFMTLGNAAGLLREQAKQLLLPGCLVQNMRIELNS